ncbi:hypothetical protein BD560DRAFT_411792, partial [Blakeslea trispora]
MKDGACMVYKSVAKSRREWLPFELVTPKYLSSYKRFQSRNSNVITIKCPRIDTIVFLTDPKHCFGDSNFILGLIIKSLLKN